MSRIPGACRDSDAARYSSIARKSQASVLTPSSTPKRRGSPAPGAGDLLGFVKHLGLGLGDARPVGDGRHAAKRRDRPETLAGGRGRVEAALRHLEEQRQPAFREMAEDEVAGGHGHQLEQHRLGDAIDIVRAAEDVVTGDEALGHLDPRHAVEGERHDLVDELIRHGIGGPFRGPPCGQNNIASAAMPRRAEPMVWTMSRIVGSARIFSSSLGGTMTASPGSISRTFVKLEIAEPSAFTMWASFLSASFETPPTRLM